MRSLAPLTRGTTRTLGFRHAGHPDHWRTAALTSTELHSLRQWQALESNARLARSLAKRLYPCSTSHPKFHLPASDRESQRDDTTRPRRHHPVRHVGHGTSRVGHRDKADTSPTRIARHRVLLNPATA